MDETHKAFVALVDALLAAADCEVMAYLDALVAHARQHFDDELEWMTRTAFPALECHVEEHEKVLQSAEEVRELVRQGDPRAVHDFARALKDWFPGHADYMDAALAQWVVRKESGGVPIVLRRRGSVTD